MNTISARWRQLLSSFQSKGYRHAFVDSHIGRGVAYQIRAMQQDRNWSQKELGYRLDVPQSEISKLENPNYGRYTLKTLKRVAEVFDVALVVKFVPFSRLIDEIDNFSDGDLIIPSFDKDPGLRGGVRGVDEVVALSETTSFMAIEQRSATDSPTA